jgi:hypothetical protein
MQSISQRISEEICDFGSSDRIDEVVRQQMHELGDQLIQCVLRDLGNRIRFEQHPPHCACGGERYFKQMRPLRIRTALTGRQLVVPSPYLLCENCNEGQLWLRELLHLDEDGCTPFLQELAIEAGTIEPFEPAAEHVLKKFAEVDMSGSKVHTLCLDAGQVADELMREGELGDVHPITSDEKLYIQIDGGLLHIDGDYHEVKLGIIFRQGQVADISQDRRQILERHVVSTLDDREELGPRLYKLACRYLPKDADGIPIIKDNVVVLGDGSPWIKNLVEEDLPGAHFILDWYHVCEHISKTARVLYPENATQRKRFRSRHKNLLRTGFIDKLLRGLSRLHMRLGVGSPEQERVAGLFGYLNERRDQLGYAQALHQGLYIGSGIVESAISHVLQQRMKRTGMRWKREGATSMSALRCAYRSTGGLEKLFKRLHDKAA